MGVKRMTVAEGKRVGTDRFQFLNFHDQAVSDVGTHWLIVILSRSCNLFQAWYRHKFLYAATHIIAFPGIFAFALQGTIMSERSFEKRKQNVIFVERSAAVPRLHHGGHCMII